MFAIGQESDLDEGRYLSCLHGTVYKQVFKLLLQPAPIASHGNLCCIVNGVLIAI